jgi:hypothetical protein
MLCLVRLGEFMIGQVGTNYDRLGQVRSGYERFGQVRSG